MIIVIAIIASTSIEINHVYADCNADVDYDLALEESELVFTGTVTRLDNYDGPQKVTFFVHDIIKGEINTPKHVLENSGKIFLENDSIRGSSINVDYKIGKTYKVFVENGQTSQCTTKITDPPADYMWEPGPEDGNYYSTNPIFEDPCEEGYGLSDDVCITLEEMNKDNPICSANPKHDFGKCNKNTEEPPNTFEQVKAHCSDGGSSGEDIFLEWWDDDVYYNNEDCEILYRDSFGGPLPEPEPEQDIPRYGNCGLGTTLQDDICVADSENENTKTGVRWGGPYDTKQPTSNLNPIPGYDYEFSDIIIFASMVLVGCIICGIIFMIWRKRK